MFSLLRRRRSTGESRMSPEMRVFAAEVNDEINDGLDQMRRGFRETESAVEDERPIPRRAVG